MPTLGLPIAEDELKEVLVQRLELVSERDFDQARRTASRFRVPLDRALLERTGMPLGFFLRQLAEVWEVGFIDLKVSDVSHDALVSVGEEYARRHGVLAFDRKDTTLAVAMVNPRDTAVIAGLERMTLLKVVPYLAPEIAIRRAHLLYRKDLRDLLGRAGAEQRDEALPSEQVASDEQAAIRLLDRILAYAAVARSSDIHIEPFEIETIVRCRTDGRLHDVLSIAPAALTALVVRIKLLCGMRIDERRAPQDGQFKVDLGGVELEFRVSTLPTVWGEKVVLRVHSKEIVLQDLEDLGLAPSDYAIVLRNVRRPWGMIVATGPTASGKSTSLYAMIMQIEAERQNSVNISTIEDPVEYRLPRVNQVQVNPLAGVEFGTSLRALLRQDPDVIMVGEIRDLETAELAVRAALVGRLMLSTLHTNDAAGAIPRLLDIGVEPFLVASTLSLVMAQRLVRRICLSCRESYVPDPSVLGALRSRPDFERIVAVLRAQGVLAPAGDPLAALRLYRGRGCVQCSGTGFRRRLAVFELLEIDDEIRAMIRARRDAVSIREAAIARGMKTMLEDGLAKAFLGETTLEEVFRVAL